MTNPLTRDLKHRFDWTPATGLHLGRSRMFPSRSRGVCRQKVAHLATSLGSFDVRFVAGTEQ